MGQFIRPDLFVVEPLPVQVGGGWKDWTPPKPQEPEWAGDEEKKKLFGIELAKGHPSQYLAACSIFDDASNALWASINWLNDPIVIAARDLYLKTVQADTTLLDKSQLATRLLQFAEERHPINGFPIVEADIRLKAYELYAKVQGFLKPDNANGGTFVHNEMKLVVVKPDHKEETTTTIDIEPNSEDETFEPLPLKISVTK